MNIPEIPLRLVPDSDEAKRVIGFKWAGGDVGRRSKIGGEPTWIVGDETPTCSCGSPMTFYGQLDSVGDDVCLADVGIVYVFVCFNCYETKSVLQSS